MRRAYIIAIAVGLGAGALLLVRTLSSGQDPASSGVRPTPAPPERPDASSPERSRSAEPDGAQGAGPDIASEIARSTGLSPDALAPLLTSVRSTRVEASHAFRGPDAAAEIDRFVNGPSAIRISGKGPLMSWNARLLGELENSLPGRQFNLRIASDDRPLTEAPPADITLRYEGAFGPREVRLADLLETDEEGRPRASLADVDLSAARFVEVVSEFEREDGSIETFFFAAQIVSPDDASDWNRDGVTDARDTRLFLDAFRGGARRADLDADGSIDLSDLTSFLERSR